ncbi:MAG TPA: response regulator transcription factor [Chthoniobacterales bacterium]|jgi:DNA-binding NarL/FixJ family response regulator
MSKPLAVMLKEKRNAAGPAKARLLLVDDQPIVREQLAHLIAGEPGLFVCGETDDMHEAMELIAATRPDLVITGLSLKEFHGLGLIKDLRARFPRQRVLVFSMYDESLYADRAIRAGAHGFVQKRATTTELLRAIHQVLSGQVYLSEKVAADKIRRFFGRPLARPGSPLEQLSDRELEVLQLIGQGRSTRDIAEVLHLDIKTIETYRSRIKVKLKLNDARELVREAHRYSFERAHASHR